MGACVFRPKRLSPSCERGDHPLARVGVRQMIETDPKLEVCGEAGTAAETLPPDQIDIEQMVISQRYDLYSADDHEVWSILSTDWRGGALTKVITPGTIAVGDSIRIEP